MEDGDDGTTAAAASPRRIVYNPFAENAEAGPSRPRLSQPSRASPPLHDPPSDDEHEPSADESGASADSDASDGSGDSNDSDSSHDDAAPSLSSHSGGKKAQPGDEGAPPNEKAMPGDKEPPGDTEPPGNEEAPPPKNRGGRPRVPKLVQRRDVSGAPGFKWYDGDLSHHESYTERHFRGVFSERENPVGWEPSVALPILSFWTPEEKGLFFAALARHSRLRPDLIALDVQTKTELEVSQYIDLLETSIELRPNKKGQHDETQEWRDHLLGDGAYEAPPDVVEREEHLAGLLELIDQSAEDEKKADFNRVPGRPSRPMTRDARAAIEEWGQDLTTDKMDLTADLLWLATAGPQERAPQEGETEKEAIEADNEMIDILKDIPQKDRTPTQAQTFRMLNNRRKMRQKYRRKRLHAQGWTDEQIDAAGGPDAVFVALKPGGAKRKGKAANVEEVDPALAEMQQLGLEAYLENRGWELFNFDRMPQFIELYQSAYGVDPATYTYGHNSTTTTRGTSFAVLFLIYKLLWTYVRDMIRHSYIIATVGDIHNREIQEWHVESLIQAHGIPEPRQQLRDTMKQLQRLSQMSRDRAADVIHGAEPPEPPEPAVDGRAAEEGDAEESDDEAETRHPDRQGGGVGRARKRPTYAPLREMAPAPPILVEPPPDSDVWLPVRTKTDDEDSELDERLEAVDTALDTVMGYQLRGAAKSHSGLRLDDHAWLDKPGNRGAGWRDARALVPVPFDARAQLAHAQKSYRELMAKVTADRRRRRMLAERTKRFPRYQAEKAAARNRRNPPVPLHVLAQEWMDDDATLDDDEVRERPLDLPRITKKTPRRTRKRRAESSKSDDSEAEKILRRRKEMDTPRKRQKQAEEQPRHRSGSVSDQSEDWEASGDSSAAMTTDEDEPVTPSGAPVIVLSEESGDEPMDVDAQPVNERGAETEDDGDEPSMEVLGGDDALDSGDEADEEPANDQPVNGSADGLAGGDDALDSDDSDTEPDHDAADETDDKADESDEDDKFDEPDESDGEAGEEPDRSAEDLVGGDDALDSASEARNSTPLPNGRTSSSSASRSPQPAAQLPNGSLSPHKPSNGPPTTQRSASIPYAVYKKADSDSEEESDVDRHVIAVASQLSQHLPDSDGPEDESDGSRGPVNGSAAPMDGSDGPVLGLLGGDDALDTDSD